MGTRRGGEKGDSKRRKQLRGGDGVRQGERGKEKDKKNKKGISSPRGRITMDGWQWCIGALVSGEGQVAQIVGMAWHDHSLTRGVI